MSEINQTQKDKVHFFSYEDLSFNFYIWIFKLSTIKGSNNSIKLHNLLTLHPHININYIYIYINL